MRSTIAILLFALLPFGAPSFDANAVTRRVVGNMTWQSETGTLSYSVDGVSVTKKLVRQPLENDNYAGQYMGALSWVNSCTGKHENYVEIVVTQVDQNVTLNWQNEATRDTCSMSDPLLAAPASLSAPEFDDLVDFLRAGLLDPGVLARELCLLVPPILPSGMRPLAFEGRAGVATAFDAP